jgi:phage shock protein A
MEREQIIKELDTQLNFAEFIKSNRVLLSAKCAQFCLEHIQYYEQKVKELTEENENLHASCTEFERKCASLNEENERLTTRLVEQSAENIILIAENDSLSQSLANSKSILANSKADAVRKMQERLKAESITIQDHTGKLGSVVLVGTIDQIVKEMLKEE